MLTETVNKFHDPKACKAIEKLCIACQIGINYLSQCAIRFILYHKQTLANKQKMIVGKWWWHTWGLQSLKSDVI